MPYSIILRISEYKILAFIHIRLNIFIFLICWNMALYKGRLANFIVVTLFIGTFLFSASIGSGLASNLLHSASAVSSTSDNNTQTAAGNITVTTGNMSTTGDNGSIATISPEEIEDRRHAPS
jgi:hypothetical protein